MRSAHDSAGFGVYVADMFHNIVLPVWLRELLPLSPVAFGDLSGDAQRALCKQLKMRVRPKQSTKFRPLQATLPMGFKWGVTLAHSILSAVK